MKESSLAGKRAWRACRAFGNLRIRNPAHSLRILQEVGADMRLAVVESRPVDGYLTIISCGKNKIWDRQPGAGPTAARYAYTSPVFKTSCRYAECFAARWMILSAKYGFIDPDFIIPENYDVTWYDQDAVAEVTLRQQVETQRLADWTTVGVLGTDAYWSRVRQAFDGLPPALRHVNGSKAYPPVFIGFINELIAKGTPFSEADET